MSRLLFAAARGARIERLWFKHKDEPYNWEKSTVINAGFESDYAYRIRPEDAHLEYGPISTALREKATHAFIGTEFSQDVLSYMDTCPRIPASEYWDWLDAKELHRSLFLLILAESLADEGL